MSSHSAWGRLSLQARHAILLLPAPSPTQATRPASASVPGDATVMPTPQHGKIQPVLWIYALSCCLVPRFHRRWLCACHHPCYHAASSWCEQGSQENTCPSIHMAESHRTGQSQSPTCSQGVSPQISKEALFNQSPNQQQATLKVLDVLRPV